MSLPLEIGRFGIHTADTIVERAFRAAENASASAKSRMSLELNHGRVTVVWTKDAHDDKVFATFHLGSDPDWLLGEVNHMRLNTGSRKR
jgi:hypothetical protein